MHENVRKRARPVGELARVTAKRAAAQREAAKREAAVAGAPVNSGYHDARTSREQAEARLAQLRALEAGGVFVNRERVRREMAQRLAGLRNSLLQIPARLQSVVAAEADEAKCHDLMQDELLQVLSQFVEAIPMDSATLLPEFNAASVALAEQLLREFMAPPHPLTVTEWAERDRRLGKQSGERDKTPPLVGAHPPSSPQAGTSTLAAVQ